MTREQLERTKKVEAIQKFAEPVKQRKNNKESRELKAKQVADSLIAATKEGAVTVKKKPKSGRFVKKFTSRRKSFIPERKEKIFFGTNEQTMCADDSDIENVNPKTKEASKKNADLDNQVSKFKTRPPFTKSRFLHLKDGKPVVFMQRNLAYKNAFKKLTENKQVSGISPPGVAETCKKQYDEVWIYLNHFKYVKKRPLKHVCDVNLTIDVFEFDDSKPNHHGSRRVSSFKMPIVGPSPFVKNESSRAGPRNQFCQFPVKVNDGEHVSPSYRAVLSLTVEVIPKGVEKLSPSRMSRQVFTCDIVRQGRLVLPRVQVMNFTLQDLSQDGFLSGGSYKFGCLNMNLYVVDQKYNGFIDRCYLKRSVKNMGKFYENPESKERANLKEADFLSSDDNEDNIESLSDYFDSKCRQLEKCYEREDPMSVEIDGELEAVNRKRIEEVVGRQRLFKAKRSLDSVLEHLKTRLNAKKARRPNSLNYTVDVFGNDSIEGIEKSQTTTSCQEHRLNKFDFCKNCQMFVREKDFLNFESHNDQDISRNIFDILSVETEQREFSGQLPKVVKLRKGFVFDETETLPIEFHLVTGNKSSLKFSATFPFCVFCEKKFECYEVLLLHLHYSHVGYKVIHFPSNLGSVIEIVPEKRKKQLKMKKVPSSKKRKREDPRKEMKSEKGTANQFLFLARKNILIDEVPETSVNNFELTPQGSLEERESRKVIDSNMLKWERTKSVNAVGLAALNQVTFVSDSRACLRFTKLLKSSKTLGTFYHSGYLSERQFVSQGYCSDNDDDSYPWLNESEQRLMDEYIDATEKEKRLMLLWNAFYRNVSLGPGDCRVPMVVEAFLETHSELLKREGLLMLMNLHVEILRSFGIIPQSFATSIIARVEHLRLVDSKTFK